MKFHSTAVNFQYKLLFLVNKVQTKRKTNLARSRLLGGRGKPQTPTFQPIISEYHQLMHSDQKQTFQICITFSLM